MSRCLATRTRSPMPLEGVLARALSRWTTWSSSRWLRQAEPLGDADLLVVGGPTHFHGMSSTRTRKWAASITKKPKNDLVLDRDAQGPGVGDWLRSLGDGRPKVAAFDTRFKGPAVLRGRASRAISRKLRSRGFEVVAKPESFFVTLQNHLEPGEEARAQEWGKRLAARVPLNDVTNGDGPRRPPTSKES